MGVPEGWSVHRQSKVRAKCSSLGIEQTKAWKNIGNWPGWDSADTDWNVALKGSDLKSSFDASNPCPV